MSSRTTLLALTAAVALLVGSIGVLATVGGTLATDDAVADDAPPSQAVTPRTPVRGTEIERLHTAGITGEGVDVGIVDVTGFDPDHPGIADHVADARSFSPGEGVANGGRDSHGTAAASLVSRNAPDSDLYLASVDTASGYESAVEWLVSEDVDVIVAPMSFYGKPDDGESHAADVARRATETGVVFVAPVGNLAQGHWNGTYQPVNGGVHSFDGGTRNYLRTTGQSRLRLWLSWDEAHRTEEYTAELYWTNGTAHRLVARSQPYLADSVPNERIVARLQPGTYYVRITGPANATGAHLDLESPTHALQFQSPGSVAPPATDPSVLAVGAYDPQTGAVRPYSSGGPTGDERGGVDVVAPDGQVAATKPDGFNGTSAAAAYTAGTVALMLDANRTLSPAGVERSVTTTASDVQPTGPDRLSGAGSLEPTQAVAVVHNDSNDDLSNG
ncbi:S8 family peptidase [Haloarcula halophila]|uniref:S8 family peptidase n=1 Tax=Haloarcula TaxID=2237 RepID=UPI0023E3E53A|nr:S8 family serine peptidase [Halomicroarcula sp. DFY41]